ncbi:hypothetical protein P3S67_029930 [Capsicum chacoense]
MEKCCYYENFAVSSPQVALRMLTSGKDDDYREFYSVSMEKGSSSFLPVAKARSCLNTGMALHCAIYSY